MVEEAVRNETGTLIWWAIRNPSRVFDVKEPHMYAFGQPEFDSEEIGKASVDNLIGSLGSDRFIRRFERSCLADPKLVEPAFVEQEMVLWKENKVISSKIDESRHEYERRRKRSGLSEGASLKSKDRNTYILITFITLARIYAQACRWRDWWSLSWFRVYLICKIRLYLVLWDQFLSRSTTRTL